MNSKQKVVCILGPTGVGKSSFSIKIAKKYNCEIISCDSVQIFKEFDIGSAKITDNEKNGIEHFGIDIVSPSDEFSVFDYMEYAKQTIEHISNKGKIPLMVGGTALYVKALMENYNLGSVKKDINLREKIENEINENGIDRLIPWLNTIAPNLTKNLDVNNKVRVIRACEIAYENGDKEKNESSSKYDFKVFALIKPRDVLYDRINQRVDEMIKQGLEGEVEKLFDKYGDNCQPMKAIGYKEVLSFIKGEINKDRMIELIKQHSRNYAKRQITFLKTMKDVSFIDTTDTLLAMEIIDKEIDEWLVKQKY